MLSTDAFRYVNVLDRAADASWNREATIANNIANADTPGYKREDIDFASVLKRELWGTKVRGLDKAVKELDLDQLKGQEYIDYPGYSYRIDGNNVDIDTENVELASEQLNYQTLTQSIKSEFQRFSAVIK